MVGVTKDIAFDDHDIHEVLNIFFCVIVSFLRAIIDAAEHFGPIHVSAFRKPVAQ